VLHAIVASIGFFDVGNLFSSRIKDSGYVVFDFIDISKKSKAPILSNTEGRISKTKSFASEDERMNTKTRASESEESVTHEEKEPVTHEEKKPVMDTAKKANDKQVSKKDVILNKPKKRIDKIEKNKIEKNMELNKKNVETSKKNDETSKPKIKKIKNKGSDKAVVNLGKNKGIADKKSAKKSFDSMLNNAIASSDNENAGIKAEEVGETLTASQIDLVRQTIRKCWHFPSGLKDAANLVVDIKMELDKDGNVKRAEIVDNGRMSTDSNYKIAAENAYRAVLDPDCNPLPLPKEKYEEWKDLELSFNPKDMFG
jgi:hypothetical protein